MRLEWSRKKGKKHEIECVMCARPGEPGKPVLLVKENRTSCQEYCFTFQLIWFYLEREIGVLWLSLW